ncbi:MAG: hypothetical protein EXR81_04690 [Gammaproteobacteria bacterium]|nr:hypothetical protein [Gammaproteobacteria bacterium]
MIKKIILTITLALFAVAYAGEHGDMQVDCHSDQIHYAKEKVWLNQKMTQPSAHLYIIHNLDKTQFWLNHEALQPMHAGWSSHISSDKWSALKMSEPKFNLNCMKITSAGTQTLDCAKLLRICVVTNVQYPKKDPLSSYWVSEDQPKSAFYKSVIVRGFSFKSTSN